MEWPNTSIASTVTFGEGCQVWQYATVCEDTVIGNHVVIGSGVWIGKHVEIGSYTRIQHGAFVPNNTKIGAHVFLGPNSTLTDDKYPRAGNAFYVPEPPILKDYCSIGAGAVILPGVTVGEKAMVGAGAVVSQDVRPFTTVAGVPARILSHNKEELYETA